MIEIVILVLGLIGTGIMYLIDANSVSDFATWIKWIPFIIAVAVVLLMHGSLDDLF